MKKALSVIIISSFCLGFIFTSYAAGSNHSKLAGILKKAMPAVVNISSEGSMPKLPHLKKQIPAQGKFYSIGSGVIIETKITDSGMVGYIVTNAHVVANTTLVEVTLNDGRQFTAKKVGEDPSFDIAVLKIIAHNKLTELPIGDSNAVEIGDTVTAIGSPFGLKETVTSGIVSAINRSQPGMKNLANYIQTDAQINPGNSGGALINMRGQLVGINTSIVSKDGGSLGIGFAIPSNIAKAVANQLIKYGKVKRGQLGVMVQSITPELADSLHIKTTSGAIITTVTPNTPAQKAGLKVGDIITTVNSTKVHSNTEVVALVGLMRPGVPFKLSVLTKNGAKKTLSLATADPDAALIQEKKQHPYLYGVTLKTTQVSTIGNGKTKGLLITSIAKQSNAANAGLMPGDIIVAANQKPTTTVKQLTDISKTEKNILLLTIKRGHGTAFVPVSRNQPYLALGNL